MLPININISDVIEEFSLSRKQIDIFKQELLSTLANELYRFWVNEARQGLKQSRREYISGLSLIKEGNDKAGVQLVGWLPNRIEGGCAAFDIKLGFFKSSKAKVGKNGQIYMTIPFRIGIPSTIGDSEVFSNIMPASVYKIAKQLKQKEQVSKSQLPKQFQQLGVRKEVTRNYGGETKLFESYTHKAPIFQGITKGQGQYHGQYSTFRRVSDKNSDPNSWIHSGIVARKLADVALKKMDVPNIVQNVTDNFLNNR